MEKRERIIGRQYELARICVPPSVADYIVSKRDAMKRCECRKVYEELKEQYRLSPNYAESRRLQYLSDLFWVLSGATPVLLRRMGMTVCVPTDYLEREDSSFGLQKVQECAVLSLRVEIVPEQMESIRRMEGIVKKMRSFKTDFYFHDMKIFARELCKKPILWIVGTSHTFTEVIEPDEWAEHLMKHLDSNDVKKYLRHGEDETWVGSALRVACGKDDVFYYHDGKRLLNVTRERFTSIHNEYVRQVRDMVLSQLHSVAA